MIISDSMGRPWRAGITDAAIGVAGLTALTDPRGRIDVYGNVLDVTQVAVADEIAAAADLVKGKLGGVPVAIVRGLAPDGKLPDDGHGSRELIRGADDDLFRLGTAEAIARRPRGRRLGRATPRRRCTPTPSRVIGDGCRADDGEAAVRQAFLGFLAARPDAMWRSCAPGHLTASALVRRPVAPAGAADAAPAGRACGCSSAATASPATTRCSTPPPARRARRAASARCRSTRRRSAWTSTRSPARSGVPTRHFDVRFLAVAPDGAEPVRSDESLDLRWFGWDDLPDGVVPGPARAWSTARPRLRP